MQGRGRGSYLGLLLEFGLGKPMVDSANGADTRHDAKEKTMDNSIRPVPRISPPLQADAASERNTSQKYSHSTWTSLDLLGNKERRARHGKEVSKEWTLDAQQKVGENESYSDRNSKDVEGHETQCVTPEKLDKQCSPASRATTPQCSSPVSVNLDATQKVHLFSPQEFLPHSSCPKESEEELDSSCETCDSNSSSSSRYIPPHRRKGFDEKPEIFSETSIIENRRTETRRTKIQEQGSSREAVDAQKLIESELNWQKWKLQRNFKKMLNSLAVDSAMRLSKDIEEMLVASRLSTKFPGVSEVNVILELLVSRVVDKKETVEVAVQVCRLLNAMYPDEFPSNLSDVLKEFRKDAFCGVANKNSRCDKFCLFLGKLCDVARLETKSFQECVKQSVIGCLQDWISPFQSMDECSTQEAEIKVVYLCDLLEMTKNTIDVGRRSWIKSCFGKIKNCILCDKLPRNIRENLLDVVVKHLLQYPIDKQTVENKGSPDNDEVNSGSAEVAPESSSASEFPGDSDLYKDVKKMLSELGLGNLLEKFQDNLIRDTLLHAEKNELKNTLQEAGFAPGAILEIQLYLEKNGVSSQDDVKDKLTNDHIGDCEHSPVKSTDSDTLVRNLESNLQQILCGLQAEREKGSNSEGEKTFSKMTEAEKFKHVELKEARDESVDVEGSLNEMTLPRFTSTCRTPPGFSNPGIQNRRTPSPILKDMFVPVTEERQHVEVSSVEREQIPKREVFLWGKRPDDFKYKYKESFGNEVVNWSTTGGNYKRNPSERGFSKHRGRGRGRRDNTGSLETSRGHYRNGHSGTRFGRKLDESERNCINQTQVGFDTSLGGTGSPSPSKNMGVDSTWPSFGSSMAVGCFICKSKTHSTPYCTDNAAMFD